MFSLPMKSAWVSRVRVALAGGVVVWTGVVSAAALTVTAPGAGDPDDGLRRSSAPEIHARGAGVVAAVAASAADVEGERAARLLALGHEAASRSDDGRVHLTWPAVGAMTGWWMEPRGNRPHPGMDIDGTTGDPAYAAGAGTVKIAGPAPQGFGGYGNMVMIDHGHGVETLYAHLDSVVVTVGQTVRPGTHIGAIGNTGASMGSHLHFEVRVGGVQQDPAAWLPPRS